MENNLLVILLVVTAIIIILLGFIWHFWRSKKQLSQQNQLQLDQASLNDQEHHQLLLKLAVAEEKIKHQENVSINFQQLQEQLLETKTENAALQTQLQEQQKNTHEKLQLLQSAEAQLKSQFENLANKIFEDRSKQFSEQNKTSMEHIVSPIKSQLTDFKQRVESVYENETKDRISLREEIVSLRRDTEKMNQEALNLTRALKGDKKAQGNWGE